nr:uncharacterized protein LOC110360169 isoform X3 [Columba livia]
MPFCAQAAAREEESQHQLFPGFALCLSSLPALPGRRRGLPGSLWLHSFHLLASKYELQINIIGLALQKNGVMSGDAALRTKPYERQGVRACPKEHWNSCQAGIDSICFIQPWKRSYLYDVTEQLCYRHPTIINNGKQNGLSRQLSLPRGSSPPHYHCSPFSPAGNKSGNHES